ncbi:MAG: PEP-CTERM sorting domain-containing protein [Planctomycetota bacterium]
MKTLNAPLWCASGIVTLMVSSSACASVVTGDVLETFDDAVTDVTFGFVDEDTISSGTSPTKGVAPGWTIVDGQAVFYNNTNFFDSGVAVVSYSPAPSGIDFSVSSDFDVFQEDSFSSFFNYTQGNTGVVAYADASIITSEAVGDTGIYAYVDEFNTSGSGYQFVVANDGAVIATSSSFDLTDGSPDFTIDLAGSFDGSGNLQITASLTDINGANNQTLTPLIAAVDVPAGDQFGVRVSPGFNGYEVGVDNLSVVVPEPGSLTLGALGGLALLARRRGA